MGKNPRSPISKVKAVLCALLSLMTYLTTQLPRWVSWASRSGISVAQRETRSRPWIFFLWAGKVLNRVKIGLDSYSVRF